MKKIAVRDVRAAFVLMLWVCFVFFGVKINYIFFRKTLFGGVYEEVS